MKNLSVKIQNERHKDLIFIQEFYSEKTGIKLNQTQVLEKLLFETANVIRNTGYLKYEIKENE
ncbi:MAG: hypothetical protein L0J96_11325 [Lactococcus lactis]|nr:hypothetical protein [Lactococcus lactis]